MVLGSQLHIVLQIQLRLGVALTWLELDDKIVLHCEYGVGYEVLVVRGEDLRGDGYVAFCSDLACNIHERGNSDGLERETHHQVNMRRSHGMPVQ